MTTQVMPKLITLSYLIQLATFFICTVGWYKASGYFDIQDYDNARYWMNVLGGTALIGTVLGRFLILCSYGKKNERVEPLLETPHPPEYPPSNAV